MNLWPFFSIFITVFLAELGDKTQLAIMLFAAKAEHAPWVLFAVASLGFIAAAGFAVLLGTLAAKYTELIPFKLIAGVGFIAIGSYTLWEHFTRTAAAVS